MKTKVYFWIDEGRKKKAITKKATTKITRKKKTLLLLQEVAIDDKLGRYKSATKKTI